MMKQIATGALAVAIAAGTVGMGYGTASAATITPTSDTATGISHSIDLPDPSDVYNNLPSQKARHQPPQKLPMPHSYYRKLMASPLPCDADMMLFVMENGYSDDPFVNLKVLSCSVNILINK